jgi:hypothetical protein
MGSERLMQPGDAVDYLSSAKGWIHAIVVGDSESGDASRCLIRIDGGEALSEVSRRSLRWPQPQTTGSQPSP